MKEFESELESSFKEVRFWHIALFVSGLAVFYAFYKFDDLMLQLFVLGIGIALVVISANIKEYRESVSLNGGKLLIEQQTRFRKTKTLILISELSDLEFRRNVKSNQYTTSGRVRVLGMDVTPESMKTYYHHPEVITFTYRNERFEIGKWKKAFGGEELYRLLKAKSEAT